MAATISYEPSLAPGASGMDVREWLKRDQLIIAVHGSASAGWSEPDPDFDILRDDPRFKKLREELR